MEGRKRKFASLNYLMGTTKEKIVYDSVYDTGADELDEDGVIIPHGGFLKDKFNHPNLSSEFELKVAKDNFKDVSNLNPQNDKPQSRKKANNSVVQRRVIGHKLLKESTQIEKRNEVNSLSMVSSNSHKSGDSLQSRSTSSFNSSWSHKSAPIQRTPSPKSDSYHIKSEFSPLVLPKEFEEGSSIHTPEEAEAANLILFLSKNSQSFQSVDTLTPLEDLEDKLRSFSDSRKGEQNINKPSTGVCKVQNEYVQSMPKMNMFELLKTQLWKKYCEDLPHQKEFDSDAKSVCTQDEESVHSDDFNGTSSDFNNSGANRTGYKKYENSGKSCDGIMCQHQAYYGKYNRKIDGIRIKKVATKCKSLNAM